MPKMKTNAQNKRIFGLKGKLGLEHEDLREIAFLVSDGRIEEISKLTFDEAAAIIRTLESKLPKSNTETVSRRTINYQRQKAGVETLATPTHLDYMRKLWRKVEGRTDEGLESLSLKVIKVKKPRTSKECSKVIEAIKSMNNRREIPSVSTNRFTVQQPRDVFVLDISCSKTRFFDPVANCIKPNPNNSNNEFYPIWSIALIDEFSRVKFVRFVPSPKLTKRNITSFLLLGFGSLGVPKILYTDNNLILKELSISRAIKLLDKHLEKSGGFKLVQHLPNTRATGKVEFSMRGIDEIFTSLLDQVVEMSCETFMSISKRITQELNGNLNDENAPINRWTSNPQREVDTALLTILLKEEAA